ncbi:hypothetical protein GXP74_37920 [Streptacidiphilus sp. P02-A3a]|nr:hypothetical protein GXP74_37920 [Streptacidiphilus sp. P02-A3a]
MLGAVVILLVVVAVINRTSGSTQAGAGAPGTSGTTAGSGPTASGSGTQATATAPTGTQPVSTSQDGIATGFPHTAEGAQSAAVNYSVALGSSEMYTTTSRHTILQTIVDPAVLGGIQTRLDDSFTSQGSKLGLRLGQAPKGLTFVSRVIPVGTKVDSYGVQSTVEVWNDSLFGLAGQGSTYPVTESWYTLTVTLSWSGGDWKLADFKQADGPTPISGNQTPSSADMMANAVTGFGGFRYAR